MTAIISEDEEAGRYCVRGDMSFDTVPDLWQQSQQLFVIDGHNGLQIDLGGVQSFDSSGLALLIAWKRYAQNRTQPLTLVQVPQDLLALVRAHKVAILLGLNPVQT